MLWLQLYITKTEYPTTDVNESNPIKINGTELLRTSFFKYRRLPSDNSLMVDVNSHVRADWSRWRSLMEVICDKNMPERLNSMIYGTAVRPVVRYGAKCWPAT